MRVWLVSTKPMQSIRHILLFQHVKAAYDCKGLSVAHESEFHATEDLVLSFSLKPS